MPTPHALAKATELQRQLVTLTGHQHARVKPYGKHLLIQILSDGAADDNVDTIARLTELGRNSYSSDFRSHTGRWEPLPGTGDLATTAELVATQGAEPVQGHARNAGRHQESARGVRPAGQHQQRRAATGAQRADSEQYARECAPARNRF